jgi:cytochrome c nitrite reductase small subunit
MLFRKSGILRLSWTALAGIAVGAAAGIGGYTFVYAKGYSYLTNDPAACANCHLMQEYYDGWLKSSHRSVATCNDCHTPAGLIPKYRTKASNGFWHSYAFTTGDFPEPLRAKPHNKRIAEEACLKCHADVVETIGGVHANEEPGRSCVRCHGAVGHPR